MEENKTITWTDEQIDELLMATLERKAITDAISQAVMKDLRRAERRAWQRKWGRAAAFAFGVPMGLLTFGWLLWAVLSQQDAVSPIYICLVFPIATMLYALWRAVADFSPSRV